MRIAGAQFFDTIRSVIQAEKAREKEKNGATDPNDASGADDVITPEDIEKSTLMGMLFPVPKPEESSDNAASSAADVQGSTGGKPKPWNSVDIYV
ncbi:hypothetical protein [Caballeronia sp. dw_19]|uniref:hypothetical protein n=1 Tax=Caballeronia sp. dw_19 TaxID=2719791 RepID=UPI001BD20599|nr:hypothetical protein [Caballeronia sp. dw_19]